VGDSEDLHRSLQVVCQYVQTHLVLTRGIVLVRKCVAPIQAFSVPKGCSTVWRLILDARGVRLAAFASLETFSCSHRAMRDKRWSYILI